MSKKILGGLAAAAAMLGASQTASAFYVNAQTFVSPGYVQANVCNAYPRWMRCYVQVTGFTNTGFPVTGWSDLFVPPGACQYAYAYVNVYAAYFMSGSANANCVWY